MKKFLFLAVLCCSLGAAAQNTWEMAENEQAESPKKSSVAPKYQAGAVPVVDGKVVFSKTINAPGKSRQQVYATLLHYAQQIVQERNQIESSVSYTNEQEGEIGVVLEEWLVFKHSALVLDQTRFCYQLTIKCSDEQALVTLQRLHYVYGDGSDQLIYQAEKWITDKYAMNKKGTKLLPVSGKFRRKTIDRKDYLFNKMEELLK